jgi:hypothetical protein
MTIAQKLGPTLGIVALLAVPATAEAGPWTREAGQTFLSIAYSRIAAQSVYGPDFSHQPLGAHYEQHAVQLYGEVGLVSRWLTATVEQQIFRFNRLRDQGATYGVGDMRLGFWSGIITQPVRLTAAFLAGVPIGDPSPSAGPAANAEGQLIARSLPTGDGEADFELRLSFGYSFGRVRRWPLAHYLVLEAGYWFRSNGRSKDLAGRETETKFADDFTYKAELGTKLPWRFVDRFWFIGRFAGIESFASSLVAASSCASGLGNGVTYTAYGFEIAARIYKGLGVNFGLDGAARARCVAAAANMKAGMTMEF